MTTSTERQRAHLDAESVTRARAQVPVPRLHASAPQGRAVNRGWALVDVTIALLTLLLTALVVGLFVGAFWLIRAGWRDWHQSLSAGAPR